MPPGTVPLTLYQGDDFAMIVSFNAPVGVPFDITGYTFRAQVRPYSADQDGSADPLATFDCEPIDPSAGSIQIGLDHAATELLPTSKPSRWDLEGTDVGGRVTTYLVGPVTVLAEVTR